MAIIGSSRTITGDYLRVHTRRPQDTFRHKDKTPIEFQRDNTELFLRGIAGIDVAGVVTQSPAELPRHRQRWVSLGGLLWRKQDNDTREHYGGNLYAVDAAAESSTALNSAFTQRLETARRRAATSGRLRRGQ